MDFKNLNADVNLILKKHYSAGRNGYKVKYIVPHYAAGDLSLNGYYSVWQSRQASAHYAIDSKGKCAQLVWDRNTAWSLGNFTANCQSISIEHSNRGNTITSACRETGAHLVAALCIEFKLGRPQWGKNVRMHREFSSTDCPGPLASKYKSSYIKRAQYWYDKMTKESSKPSTSKPNTSKPSTSKPTTSTNYTVKITSSALNIRKGPGTNYGTTGSIRDKGYYTIVKESKGKGAKKWGKLKSGVGWISLDFTRKEKPPAKAKKKSVTTIAKEVIAGKWGNGDTRKKKLEAAGYNYNEIQKKVNQLL